MKRSILRALALCLTTTFVAGYAQAKDDNDKSSGTDTTKSPTTQRDYSTGANAQGGPGSSTSPYSAGTSASSSIGQSGQPIRLSRLMNTSLPGQSGSSLGQVQDIIVDPATGQAQFVVIALNSSAAGAPGSSSATGTGIGDTAISSPRSAPSTVGSYGTPTGGGRLVAIPWRLLSRSSSDQFMANVDSSKLQSAPTFSMSAWPTMDSAWSQRINSHFGVDATSTGAPGSSSSSGTGTGTGTGTGLGNPSTPGLPSTPGTPDINPPNPSTSPGASPSTSPSTTPSGAGSK